MIRNAFIILVLTVAAAGVTNFLHPRPPLWHSSLAPMRDDEVNPAEVEKRWRGEVLWIDARARESYDKEHVPGALLINEQELDTLLTEHFEKLQDNKKPIVVYCDGKACHASRKIRDYLAEKIGLDNLFVLVGGWPAWKAANPGK